MGLSYSYFAYMRSPEWKERRRELLDEVDWECENCGGKANQVHHVNYDSFGDEDSDDVECLCFSCHEEAEEEKGNELGRDEEYDEY